jgi:2-(1,2-epoxy-1,2-dihydrophenyl)acetyl-CoA isomerase
MAWEHITLAVSDSIATITLNRPEALNAFAGSMREDLVSALQEAAKCSRVVVLTGAGKAFCAGGDVRVMATASLEEMKPRIGLGKKIAQLLEMLPVPTLASLNGVAAGAGFSLALACDLRIASGLVHVGGTYSRIGLHPDWGATYFLTRLVGPGVARELIFTGRLVAAEEALRLGLVNWVVAAEELERRTREKAEELRDAAPLALSWSKRGIALAEKASLEEVLDFEERAQLACLQSEDAREGMRAFLDKRRPDFKGR